MVKNIIFDLGGVILDLAVPQALSGFSKLSGLSPKVVTDMFRSGEGFLAFEKGEITEKEFREFVRKFYKIDAGDEQLDECWNAMLLTIPPGRLDLLTALKGQYRTFLLSNTNPIHLSWLNDRILPAQGINSLEDYFHKTYYSHLMKKRKPDAEIFVQVLEENNLRPEETLFLDDNAENIEGAKIVGIQTAYVNTNDFILNYFHEHRTA